MEDLDERVSVLGSRGVDLMAEIVRNRPGLAGFFFSYYVLLLGYGVVTAASQAVFYAVFLAGAAALVAWMYSAVRLSSLVLWGLALWGFAHMVGGLVEIEGEVVYEHSLGGGQLRFDKVVHFFGFGFATLAAYVMVRQAVGPVAPARRVALTAAFVGLGVGAVNETIEFLVTLLPTRSNVGGFSNTGWDLVANAAGTTTAAWLAP